MKFKAFLLIVIAALFALPTLAQQPTTTTVRYGDFGFSVEATWASQLGIDTFAGDPVTIEQPGGPEVKHVQFLVSNSAAANMYDATLAIRLYQAADFAAYPVHQATLEQLQSLLSTRSDLGVFMNHMMEDGSNTSLPFLPVMPAIQVIRSQARYVETAAVRGISYVTAYRQDASPFTASDFYYTFQGVSADGVYYVSVVARPTTALFPSEIAADFDYNAFTAGFSDYMNQSVTTLNAASDADFSPSLSAFDAVATSMTFGNGNVMPADPTAVPETDATLGGLSGDWTLVSYGSADAPITPIVDVPVTVTFADQGVSGTAGCNSFSGSFSYDTGTITVGSLVSTLMACDEPIMTQETAVMTALQAVTSFEVVEGQLRLTYPEGVLIFALGA